MLGSTGLSGSGAPEPLAKPVVVGGEAGNCLVSVEVAEAVGVTSISFSSNVRNSESKNKAALKEKPSQLNNNKDDQVCALTGYKRQHLHA